MITKTLEELKQEYRELQEGINNISEFAFFEARLYSVHNKIEEIKTEWRKNDILDRLTILSEACNAVSRLRKHIDNSNINMKINLIYTHVANLIEYVTKH